jgi:flagellar FliJ protein
MKKFSFNLEKVLRLRMYRERETEIELGRAIGVLTDIENHIKNIALDRQRAATERFSPDHGVMEIINWDNYILRLDKETERLLEDAAKAELVVEEKRELYLEASRDRKVLDKLKEKRAQEYRKEIFAEETRSLDEIASGVKIRERIING